MLDASITLQREDERVFESFARHGPFGFNIGSEISGVFRSIIKTLNSLECRTIILQKNPHCLREFIRISGYSEVAECWASRLAGSPNFTKSMVDFTIESYGPHSSQCVHVMANQVTTRNDGSLPLDLCTRRCLGQRVSNHVSSDSSSLSGEKLPSCCTEAIEPIQMLQCKVKWTMLYKV
jgi:hypothetical protein